MWDSFPVLIKKKGKNMAWARHPDTMTIASAQRAADETGLKVESYGWKKAYRDAYEKISINERGAKEYIQELDEELETMSNQ